MSINLHRLFLLISLFAVSHAYSQEINYSKGFEYSFSGQVFDPTSKIQWREFEAIYSYPSANSIRQRFTGVEDLSSAGTPFLHHNYSFTFSKTATRGLWTGKAGINVITQETNVLLYKSFYHDGQYHREHTALQFREVNPMINLVLDRSFFLLPDDSWKNFFFSGGLDLGVGMGSYVHLTGKTFDYVSEGPTLLSSSEKLLDERGHGANALYYGFHFGGGPQVRIGKITLYGSFNFLIAKMRKENSATFDMFNSGVSGGIRF